MPSENSWISNPNQPKPITSDSEGVTCIATLLSAEALDCLSLWINTVPGWAIATKEVGDQQDSVLKIYVANEFIDWGCRRATYEFVPKPQVEKH